MAMYYSDKQRLPGHTLTGSYIVQYQFPAGIQQVCFYSIYF
jgi:hypothetical protein